MCKYLRILTEKTLVPDVDGGSHFEDVPYAEECTKKNILSPDCINCSKTKSEYNDFVESTVFANR